MHASLRWVKEEISFKQVNINIAITFHVKSTQLYPILELVCFNNKQKKKNYEISCFLAVLYIKITMIHGQVLGCPVGTQVLTKPNF